MKFHYHAFNILPVETASIFEKLIHYWDHRLLTPQQFMIIRQSLVAASDRLRADQALTLAMGQVGTCRTCPDRGCCTSE